MSAVAKLPFFRAGDDLDALEVDDSDLACGFPLRACSSHSATENNVRGSRNGDAGGNSARKNSNSTSHRLIPGPAGSLQSALLCRKSTPIISCGRDANASLDVEDDPEFKLNPWLSAQQYFGVETGKVVPIGSIRTATQEIYRASMVAGIVKSSVPNGLGDFFITLKDPTGSIGASVHCKVLTQSNLHGGISTGCVLILKQVVVFYPVRTVCYLNVTSDNVFKIICKDSELAQKQAVSLLNSVFQPSEMGNSGATEASCEKEGHNVGETGKLEPFYKKAKFTATDATRSREAANISHPDARYSQLQNETVKPHEFTANKVILPSLDDRGISTEITAFGLSTRSRHDHGRNDDAMNISTVESSEGIRGSSSCAKVLSFNMDGENTPKEIVPRIAVMEWTDDQLSELFADY